MIRITWAKSGPRSCPDCRSKGGEVFGSIEDLQGRFNVNNLIDQEGRVVEESLQQFQRLLNALGLDPRFAGITADWIDSNLDAVVSGRRRGRDLHGDDSAIPDRKSAIVQRQ